MISKKFACTASLALVLTACGGGSSTPSATPAAPITYNIFGNVNGSPGAGLVLQLNGGSSMPVSAQGFAWTNALVNGQAYAVTVSTQPAGSTCTVSNGAGTIADANILNVEVNCVAVPGLSLLAGNMNGRGNSDGSALSARFNAPNAIGTDNVGNLLVVDVGDGAIRKIAPTGMVSTISSFSSLGISNPGLAAIDGSGNVFICDAASVFDGGTWGGITEIYKINSAGKTLVASSAMEGVGSPCEFGGAFTVDSADNLYIYNTGAIFRVSSAGVQPITSMFPSPLLPSGTGTFNGVAYIAADSAGNIYGAGGGLIQKVTPAGVVTVLAGTPGTTVSVDGTGAAAAFSNLGGITIDGNGVLYVLDGNAIRKITAAGVVTTLAGTAGVTGSADGIGAAASFNAPQGLSVDNQGNIYVTDTGNNIIRKITAAGAVTTLAGVVPVVGSSDGLGSNAGFNGPQGIAADGAGNVYVADSGNFTIRKITANGQTSTFAGTPGLAGNVNGVGAAASFGALHFVPSGYSGANSGIGPQGVATDSAGNVYVADPANANIREISPAGMVTTFAGPGAAGSLGAAAICSYPYASNNCISGIGSGIPGTAVGPYGVAVNSTGNIYLAGAYGISTINAAGVVANTYEYYFNVYGGILLPQAIVADSAGNAYVTFLNGFSIFKVTPAGVVSIFAGSNNINVSTAGSADGVGTAAGFNGVSGITIDGSDNLYVADSGNCTIRKITPAAVVSTVVGVAGQCGFVAGALPGRLSQPNNVAISGRTLYITSVNGVAIVNNVP